jgi:hypothetical protein
MNPDARDIAKVTNYLVAYASKGTETLEQEKAQLRSMILASEEATGCNRDIIALVRKILNRYLGEKLVSKQECMVLLSGMDLWTCSESFQKISLSGYSKLDKNGTTGTNRYLRLYCDRSHDLRRLSFVSWFRKYHSRRGERTFIPHFPGRGCNPIFPLTEYHSRILLLIHKPWGRKDPLAKTNFCKQLRDFLKSRDCPRSLRLTYEKDKQNALSMQEEPIDSSSRWECEEFKDDADDDVKEAIDAFASIPSTGKPVNVFNHDFDFGINYKWDVGHTIYKYKSEGASTWLENKIKDAEDENALEIRFPVNPHRPDKSYVMENLKNEQRDIALEVISKTKEWLECGNNKNRIHNFEPLRLTIRGKAGTGKTTLIHTLVTMTKTLFQTEDCVAVVCPSGCAAANAGGKTIHNRFGIPVGRTNMIPSTTKKNHLLKANARIVTLIVDERSMVSADVMGRMCSYIEQTAHNGRNINIRGGWGGIPIVLLFGDDGQLPPVETGAFDFKETGRSFPLHVVKGLEIFKTIGQNVRTLKQIQRQEKGQDLYRDILDEAYQGHVSPMNADHLMTLHLDNERYTDEDRLLIKNRSTHLFATKEPMNDHNQRCLYRVSSSENPVARIRAIDQRNTGSRRITHQISNIQKCVILSRGAKVCITGRNIRPEWGLFNNSQGTVIDIVFQNSENPNENHLPHYILVDFCGYNGPLFDAENPTVIPIVPCMSYCKDGCCSRTQIPLRLAFGQTIHTFQGTTVGPPTKTRSYSTTSVIYEPGNKSFEGHTPGLFYSGCSRGTTIGEEGNPLSSSIYFTGQNMSKERVMDMVHDKTGKLFYKVYKRDLWTRYLDINHRDICFSDKETKHLIAWLSSTRFNKLSLDTIIKAFKDQTETETIMTNTKRSAPLPI